MGIPSMPAPPDSVTAFILINAAFALSALKLMLRSLLRKLGAAAPDDDRPNPADEEKGAAEAFRRLFKPAPFGRRRGGAGDGDECLVCLAGFEPASEVVDGLPCGHVFHSACLERWLAYNRPTCPLCRARLLPCGYCAAALPSF